MEKLFSIASKIATPLSLASVIVIALFQIYRQILGLDIFSELGANATFALLDRILLLLFYLALVGLVLGVASFVYVQYAKRKSDVDGPPTP